MLSWLKSTFLMVYYIKEIFNILILLRFMLSHYLDSAESVQKCFNSGLLLEYRVETLKS